MTELYIDGQAVALPEGFSITIVDENPFFTKNGTYTYDITLSLLHPTNAIIYNHLNRINRKGQIPRDRRAYLVVDNEVVLNGTEIILGYTESEVKIQLASGNSELNFLIGGDKKLRELDLGKADRYTGDSWQEIARKIYDDLDKTYPQRNWVLAPYATGYQEFSTNPVGSLVEIGNYYSLPNKTEMPGLVQGWDAFPEYSGAYSGQVPQPYFCFIIKRIFESLGYVLTYNVMEDDPIRSKAYIVHGYRTLNFAKMLPDWTVTEFFEELERFMDVSIIIDPYTKKVRILYNYLASTSSEHEELSVLDEFSVDSEEDDEMRIQTANVAYDLDGDDYYRYMCLDPSIRKYAPRDKFSSLTSLLSKVEIENDEENFKRIFDGEGYEFHSFIGFKNGNVKTLKKVDSFKPLMNNPNKEHEDIDITLKIVPASFAVAAIRTSVWEISNPTSVFWLQIPVAEDYDDLLSGGGTGTAPEDEENTVVIGNIQDAVESGVDNEEDKGGSRLRLAIYDGAKKLNRKSRAAGAPEAATYPLPFVENLYEDFTQSKLIDYISSRNNAYNPFRLDVMNADIYSKLADVLDTKRIFKLSFVNKMTKDVNNTFVANNKKYKCIKIERTVTSLGLGKIAKGEFYSFLDEKDKENL